MKAVPIVPHGLDKGLTLFLERLRQYVVNLDAEVSADVYDGKSDSVKAMDAANARKVRKVPQAKATEWDLSDHSTKLMAMIRRETDTRFTWVKYADDEFGAGMSDSPANKSYIGHAFNQTSEAESENPEDYTWRSMAVQGLPGSDGTGILGIQRTSGDGSPGTLDTYTISYSDGTTTTYQVHNGTDGTDGIDGGPRGPTELFGDGSSWSDTSATDAYNNSGLEPPLLQFDRYTIVGDSSTASITKYWSGVAWVAYEEFVDGNLVVSGTIHGNKIAANTISAAQIATSSIDLSGFVNDLGWTNGATTAEKDDIDDATTTANSAATTANSAATTADSAYSMASTAVQPGSIITTINNASTTINGNKITTGTLVAGDVFAAKMVSGVGGYFYDQGDYSIGQALGWHNHYAAVYAKSDLDIGAMCIGTNEGVVGEATNASGHGVLGWGHTYNSVGVRGYSSGKPAVLGESTSAHAVRGTTYNSSGYWGLITYEKAYAGNGFYPFTGSHFGLHVGELPKVGDIVVARDAFGVSVDNSYPYCERATSEKDKRVVGVFAGDGLPLMEFALGDSAWKEVELINSEGQDPETEKELPQTSVKIQDRYVEELTKLSEEGYEIIGINSLGEGMINVCSENGDIEAGDYLCSSNTKGKAMRQDGDALMNYTAAKALEDVRWGEESESVKMISCTYHCG